MSSVFANSRNVLITGSQLTSTYTQTTVEPTRRGIDLLRDHTCSGALLDSNERFDPPRCAPDTRVSIIQEILEWIANDERSSILWLYGPAGAGKSALAQTIAELCQKDGRFIGSFFFSRATLNRSDGRMLVATLAYQLLLSFPAIRTDIRNCIDEDPTIFERANTTQMDKLAIQPLNRITLSWTNIFLSGLKSIFKDYFPVHRPRLIVIDALNECNDSQMQTDILNMISDATRKLKHPIKFLVASRPESHIVRTFNHDLEAFSFINLAVDNNAQNDIRTYLSREFEAIKRTHPMRSYLSSSWPPQESIEHIVRKASGEFIYATTIIKYIRSPKHRPDDRLQVILGLYPAPANEAPFAELDALYSHIFSLITNFELVMRIIGILVIPRSKGDCLGNYKSPAVIEELLSLKPGDVRILLNDLQSIIIVDEPDVPIKILHASLADYLLDRGRSEKFWIDLPLLHSFMASGYSKRTLRIIGEFRIISTSYTYIADVGGEDDHNFNPNTFQSSLVPFIMHCELSVITQDLVRAILSLDFASICQAMVTRYKAWLVLNNFYIWFLVRTFFRFLERDVFGPKSESIELYRTLQLENLKGFFIQQLGNTVPEIYLPDLITLIRGKVKRCSCSAMPGASKHFCHAKRPEASPHIIQYLILGCQLFYWDYTPSNAKPRARYAAAVCNCLKFLSKYDPKQEEQTVPGKKHQRRSNTPFKIHYHSDELWEAHLDLALVLFPQADNLNELVAYLSCLRFSPSIVARYSSHINKLTKVVIVYLQDVEPYIDPTLLPKLKERWVCDPGPPSYSD
ncbi:unnamed protein product [Cyclocybe aegerita]|uniref:Nephrocystin 3-like N-terminal domain-containing protein n=1 Tax=Cyclocybe aegerita TaxID=1973307 RepID=A0A8S0WBM0_CYCAE|nr:unnamed protein product [Cyclocybe aegerita]